jgi:A/G-specific adenine glycosylase
MDYGTHLKQTIGNVSRKSAHYAKQSTFQGSDRQIRGMILKTLLQQSSTEKQLVQLLQKDKQRINRALHQLYAEGFIKKNDAEFSL